jgi:hypothetical protein
MIGKEGLAVISCGFVRVFWHQLGTKTKQGRRFYCVDLTELIAR